MKQFVKKKVSFVMVMIMAVITVISMSLPMAVFAQGGGERELKKLQKKLWELRLKKRKL